MPAELNPQPALAKPVSPPESVLRERKQFFDDDEDEAPRPKRSQTAAPAQAPEVIPGVSNDLLLPGAIGVLAQRTAKSKCVRCWHHREDVGADDTHPLLCGRCISNIDGAGEDRRWF